MDKINPLFTATATGGRNGHTAADDGSVATDLSVPKAMGGPAKPGTSTPEHLFAAGYAACFGGARDFIGKQHKKNAAGAKVPPRCLDRPARAGRLWPGRRAHGGRRLPAAGRVGGPDERGA